MEQSLGAFGMRTITLRFKVSGLFRKLHTAFLISVAFKPALNTNTIGGELGPVGRMIALFNKSTYGRMDGIDQTMHVPSFLAVVAASP
jgi:hypothetical protein